MTNNLVQMHKNSNFMLNDRVVTCMKSTPNDEMHHLPISIDNKGYCKQFATKGGDKKQDLLCH